MAKNKIQFQEGYSLFEFFENYGTDEQCRQVLFKWKFTNGFICPECGEKSYCTLKNRNLYQCNHCHHQTSATCGTIFDSTKLPLTKWFLSIHLMTQMKSTILVKKYGSSHKRGNLATVDGYETRDSPKIGGF